MMKRKNVIWLACHDMRNWFLMPCLDFEFGKFSFMEAQVTLVKYGKQSDGKDECQCERRFE